MNVLPLNICGCVDKQKISIETELNPEANTQQIALL